MSGKKKNRKQDERLATILLLTAILNLLRAVVEILHKLLE